jgi:hypothetical protein
MYVNKHYLKNLFSISGNCICGMIVNVLALSRVEREFKSDRVQPKTLALSMVERDKDEALRRKSKKWLVGNKDNVSEWSAHTIVSASTIKFQLSILA